MKGNIDHLWQAYLDGEMSACEASEFEATLTPDQRVRIADELTFETACQTRLGEPIACPDALWTSVKADIRAEAAHNTTVIPFIKRRSVWAPVAAAAAAVVILLAVQTGSSLELMTPPDSVPTTLATGNTLASVNQFLKDSAITLSVSDPTDNGHPIQFIGARNTLLSNTHVKELYYNCCGQPVRMVVAKKGSAAAENFGRIENADSVQATRNVGAYTVALLSTHSAANLLNVFAAN